MRARGAAGAAASRPPRSCALPAASRRASAPPPCAPRSPCGELDPADPAARPADLRVWLERTGSRRNAIDVALEPDRPPDTEPPRRRGLAGARRRRSSAPVCSTAPRRATSASRPSRSSGCTRAGRGGARAAGGRISRHPGARRRRARRVALDDGATRRTRSCSRSRTSALAGLVPPARRRRPRSGLGTSPIVNLHVPTTGGDRRAGRGGARSPVQWLFDRTAGVRRRRGPVRRRLALGMRPTRSARLGRRAPRALPAGARAAAPARRAARSCSTSPSRASRARRSAPRPGRARSARPADRRRAASTSPARGPTRAGRRRWRARSAAASPPPRRARRPRRRSRRGRGMTSPPAAPVDAARRRALLRATDHLLALQHAVGWWKGELETNVTIDAEDLFLRHFLGVLDAEHDRSDGALDPRRSSAPTAPGRTSTAARPTCRRPSRPTSRSGSPATRRTPPTCGGPPRSSASRRGRADPRLHADVALADRALVVGRTCPRCRPSRSCCRRGPRSPSTTSVAGRARRSSRSRSSPRSRPRAPAAVRHRRAADRRAAPPSPADAWGRASRSLDRARHATSAARCGRSAAGAARGRSLDRRPPGGGRIVGRDPAAVGVVARSRCAPRLPARPSGDRGRARRPGRLHDRGRATGRRLEACQSPVWDTALASRAAGRRRRPADPCARRGADGSLGAGGPRRRRLVGATAAPRPAGGPSSSPTTTIPTSTTRPWS